MGPSVQYLVLRIRQALTDILETDRDTMQWTLELICRGEMSIEIFSRLQRV